MAPKGDIPTSGLGSTKSEHILNQINKIHKNDVGDAFRLPQIVACGDQSSGKSSVLARLTGIPLPQRDGLCTRFPVEIIIRHANTPLAICADVKPHHSRSPYAQSKIKEICHWIVGDLSQLSEIFDTTARTIRSYGYGEFDAGKAFVADVLRIEVRGPTGLHINIVDLPGLISSTNAKQTQDDARFAQQLVESYIASSRSLILAVIPAPSDIDNQQILSLARKYDPEGHRTLGIITKSDLIDQEIQDRIYIVASNNGRFKLQPGYFLLKNPHHLVLADRLDAEVFTQAETDFFSSWFWSKYEFDWNRVGIENLKGFLQGRIQSYYERHIPRVREEIERKMTKSQNELKALGVEPHKDREIRWLLTGLSKRFHQLIQNACDGDYREAGTDFFSVERNRLREKMHAVNAAFSDHMRDNGERRKVVASLLRDVDEQSDGVNRGRSLVTERGMMAWADRIYAETRSREFQRSSKRVFFAELFHEQSSRWPSLAASHVEYTSMMITAWVHSALHATIMEENVRSYVKTLCNDGLVEMKKLAMEELRKLIDDEEKQPVSYNHAYTNLIDRPQDETDPAAVMAEQACNEGIISLSSYYEIERKTFVDNVCRQVIERHLLSRLPDIFCPKVVTELSSESLRNLSPGSQETRSKRVELEAMIQRYRDSLAVLDAPESKP
ncbi:putative dynamin GTPase [Hypoxylon sp. NC0597]|nr:putative dynamin GTPase [Hypoxylon sp. NC0597]